MFLNETRARVSERCLRPEAFFLTSKGEDFLILVDPEDFDRVEAAGPWHIQRTHNTISGKPFYAARNLKKGQQKQRDYVLLHNFILGTKWLDHINGIGTDNRKINLRHATQSENMQNKQTFSRNPNGCRGVNFVHTKRAKRRWIGRVGDAHLGSFWTREEACLAVRAARKSLMPFSNEDRNKCNCGGINVPE